MTRVFVALSLPEATRASLAAIQAQLNAGRIVDEENLHLTLLFLGDQDDEALGDLHDALTAIASPGLVLRIPGLGSFGGARPRALWAGIAPDPALSALHRAMKGAARRAGLAVEARKFKPHVTIARFGHGFAEDEEFQRFVAAHAGLSLPPFEIRQFSLFASTLRPDGPVYEELAAYPLLPPPS